MTGSIECNDWICDAPDASSNYSTILPDETFYHKVSHFSDSEGKKNIVRVILGRFGRMWRMSAPQISIAEEGLSLDEAWANFLAAVRKSKDAGLLTFDIGPTRYDEITEGLNIPEDEDWSEPVRESEDD